MTQILTTQVHPRYANFLLAMAIEPAAIGRRIRAARDARGWTQLDFAHAANVSPSSVQRWEAGKLPPVRELMRIAPLLGVEVDYLVESEPSEPSSALVDEAVQRLAEAAERSAEAAERLASSAAQLEQTAERLERALELAQASPQIRHITEPSAASTP